MSQNYEEGVFGLNVYFFINNESIYVIIVIVFVMVINFKFF